MEVALDRLAPHEAALEVELRGPFAFPTTLLELTLKVRLPSFRHTVEGARPALSVVVGHLATVGLAAVGDVAALHDLADDGLAHAKPTRQLSLLPVLLPQQVLDELEDVWPTLLHQDRLAGGLVLVDRELDLDVLGRQGSLAAFREERHHLLRRRLLQHVVQLHACGLADQLRTLELGLGGDVLGRDQALRDRRGRDGLLDVHRRRLVSLVNAQDRRRVLLGLGALDRVLGVQGWRVRVGERGVAEQRRQRLAHEAPHPHHDVLLAG